MDEGTVNPDVMNNLHRRRALNVVRWWMQTWWGVPWGRRPPNPRCGTCGKMMRRRCGRGACSYVCRSCEPLKRTAVDG